MIPTKWFTFVAVVSVVACVLGALAARGDEPRLPFQLGKTYEYRMSGEMGGSEKFTIVDVTGPDKVKRFKLTSELDIKAANGAFRKHKTAYVFDLKGGAFSYSGEREAYFPDSPGETGKEKFYFRFADGSVEIKIDHAGRPTWDAVIRNLPSDVVGAIDQDCISHLALAVAMNALGGEKPKGYVTLFSVNRREVVRMTFKFKVTDKRRLWRKVEDLSRFAYYTYEIPLGSFWIRRADSLLVSLANQSVTVVVDLVPPE
ncbi:MAG: hypothetical protein V2A58_08870 [Planctomycetota bacterium]